MRHGPACARPGARILVVGTTGTGKTALAARLARRLGYPHVELDALHWGPGWTPVPVEVFRERVGRATRGPCWVVDGNYSVVRDLLWPAADTLVWLDFSLAVILWRLVRRTLRRCILREPLWNGNRESFRQALGRNSILLWALRTYRQRRRNYPELLVRPEYRHLSVVRLRSPREAEAWLRALGTRGGPEPRHR